MEQREKDVIQKNLKNLVEYTDCNQLFLSMLKASGAISSADIDQLVSVRPSFDKNAMLYRIIETRRNGYQQLVDALTATCQSGVLQLLTEGLSSANNLPETTTFHVKRNIDNDDGTKYKKNFSVTDIRKLIFFHLSPPSVHFTGRLEELERLEHICKSGCTSIISQTSIVGLGGIGKSELAKQFIVYMGNTSGSDISIIWLNAENEMELGDDFRTLAKDELNINIKDSSGGMKDIRTVLKEVYDYFEGEKCLFVFDNAENNEYLIKFLPLSHKFKCITSVKPSILITSRDNDWDPQLISLHSVINLDVFIHEDAVDFVKKGLRLGETDLHDNNSIENITSLVERLQYFPLAIQQAISYIQQQSELDADYGVQNYLTEFESNTKKFLNIKLSGYRQTAYMTWKTTMSKIANDESCGVAATNILHLIAFFSPDMIFVDILKKFLSDNVLVREALCLLKRYSMIKLLPKVSYASATISIHRLVQDVIRIDLASADKEAVLLSNAMIFLSQMITPDTVSHLHASWRHVKRYQELVIRFCDVPSKVVSCLSGNLRISDAENIAVVEHKYLESVIDGENKIFLVELQGQICEILRIQNQKKEALLKIDSTLLFGASFTRKTHPILLRLRHLKCKIKLAYSEFEEAKTLYQEIIEDWKNELSSDNEVEYAECLKSFANLYYNMEDYTIALNYFKQAKYIMMRRFDKDDCKVVSIKLWAKLTKCYIGDSTSVKKLKDLYKAAFKPPFHDKLEILNIGQDIIWYLFYIAFALDDTLETIRFDYGIRKLLLGDTYGYAMGRQLMYASVLNEKKLFEEALEASLKVYQICIKRQGELSYEALCAKRNICVALLGKGMKSESYELSNKICQQIDDSKNVPARSLFAYCYSKIEMAKVLEIQERYCKAYSYFDSARNDLQTVLNKTSYPILNRIVNDGLERLRKFQTQTNSKTDCQKPSIL